MKALTLLVTTQCARGLHSELAPAAGLQQGPQHALQPMGSMQCPLTSQRLFMRPYPDKCFYFKKKRPCQEGLCVTGRTAAAHTTHLPSTAGKKITRSAQRKSSTIKQREQQQALCHTDSARSHHRGLCSTGAPSHFQHPHTQRTTTRREAQRRLYVRQRYGRPRTPVSKDGAACPDPKHGH